MIHSDPMPLLSQTTNVPMQSMPMNTKFTLEQQYAQMQNQLQQYQQPQQQYQQPQYQQSDPYTSGSEMLAQSSELIRQKISRDQRYLEADRDCEMGVKQFMYSNVIPQYLQTPSGRLTFERWEAVIKELRQEYSNEEVAITNQMQTLMQDPVVLARLRELQDGTKTNITTDG